MLGAPTLLQCPHTYVGRPHIGAVCCVSVWRVAASLCCRAICLASNHSSELTSLSSSVLFGFCNVPNCIVQPSHAEVMVCLMFHCGSICSLCSCKGAGCWVSRMVFPPDMLGWSILGHGRAGSCHHITWQLPHVRTLLVKNSARSGVYAVVSWPCTT
jgi:hypothetical protein